MNIDKDKAVRSAREHGMDLEGSPVAYEFYNPATGHAVVDYTRWTHAGHLREEDGYVARPLMLAAEFRRLGELLRTAVSALRSYQHGNSAPDLAQSVADKVEADLRTSGVSVDRQHTFRAPDADGAPTGEK